MIRVILIDTAWFNDYGYLAIVADFEVCRTAFNLLAKKVNDDVRFEGCEQHSQLFTPILPSNNQPVQRFGPVPVRPYSPIKRHDQLLGIVVIWFGCKPQL